MIAKQRGLGFFPFAKILHSGNEAQQWLKSHLAVSDIRDVIIQASLAMRARTRTGRSTVSILIA